MLILHVENQSLITDYSGTLGHQNIFVPWPGLLKHQITSHEWWLMFWSILSDDATRTIQAKRARTRVPCTGRQILNHCAAREAQGNTFYKVQHKLQNAAKMQVHRVSKDGWNDFIHLLWWGIYSLFTDVYQCAKEVVLEVGWIAAPDNRNKKKKERNSRGEA